MKVNTVPTKKLAIFFAAFCVLIFAFSQSASATPHPLPPVINHVPDGGLTLPLLGLALIGIEVLRRKLKAP